MFTDDGGASDSVYWDLRAGQPPVVNNLGCSDTSVDIGETVSCSPSVGGGSPTSYLWSSREGNPWTGTNRAFSTHWDSPGRKQIVFEACNDEGCDIGEHWVDVVQRVDPRPIINTLGCSSSNVNTGETVSCQPGISGGSPSRYLWRSNGGTPSSGNSSRFSTHWDSPRNKQISLEVCNEGGCVTSQHTVVVEREISATLSVSASGEIVPGASIQVSGTGFPSFQSVSFVRIGGRTVQQRVRPSTDGNGQFTAKVTIPLLPPGNHDVVAEAGGKTATTSIRIEAAPPPNRPPMVSPISPLASLQLAVGSTQQFTAEATDPDNDLVKVEWFINGVIEDSEPILVSGTARKTWSYRVPSSGNYRVTAKFTDAADLNDSVEWRFEGMTAAQLHPPAPRIEDIGCSPITVSVGESVNCSPAVSGGDGSRYEWIAVGGVSRSGSQRTFSTSWSSAGWKEIEFETCNRLGSCDSSSQTITVVAGRTAGPRIQSLGCSPSGVEVGEFVTCHPQILEAGPVEYNWRAPGGSPSSGEGRSFRTRWRSEGSWEITLRACSDGQCASTSSSLAVSETPGGNRPPVAARVSPSSTITLHVGQAQTFAARAIDSEGNLHVAGWLVSRWYTPANAGFSSISTATQQFAHVFYAPGSYRVSVIYYDRRWEQAIVEWEVTVVGEGSNPTAADRGPQNDETYTVRLELEHGRVDDLVISVGLGPLDNPEWERAITLPSIGKHWNGFRGEISLNDVPSQLSTLNPNLWLKIVGSGGVAVGQVSSFALGAGQLLLESPNLPIPISGNENSFVLTNPESFAENIIGLNSDVENVYLYYQGLDEDERERFHQLLIATAASTGIKLTVEVVAGIIVVKAASAGLVLACGGPVRVVVCGILAPVLIYEFGDDAIEIIGNVAEEIREDFSYSLVAGHR